MRGRMSGIRGSAAALCAVLVSGIALSACGNSIPGNAVARVGDFSITKKDFDHWMQVAANSSAGAAPGQPASTQVPVPPDFTACITQKRATAHCGWQN